MKFGNTASSWCLARVAKLLALSAALSVLPSASSAATSGSKTVANGGGSVAYKNAAEVKYVGNDLLIKFTADADGSFTLTGWAQANILVVGGGGAGGSGVEFNASTTRYGGGGGGGGGGVIETNGCILAADTYSVSVGKGGVNEASLSVATPGDDGDPSTITSTRATLFTAWGGGGGGARSIGNDGGSGGGGSMTNKNSMSGTALAGGSAKDMRQGNAGGSGNKLYIGGGGGGAGEEGVEAKDSMNGGKGGDGLTSSITGSAVTYGSGGGGGSINASVTAGAGGKAGGGKGAQVTTAAVAGTKETGGGGGGCGTGAAKIGGSGGSGVVYVRVTMAMAGPLTRPKSPVTFMYDATAKTSVVETVGYTVSGANVGTNVATYVAYATPREPFTWDDDKTDTVEVKMVIEQSTKTAITGLVQPGWRGGTPTEETPAPTCTASFGAPVAYDYGPSPDGPFVAEKPTAVGNWYVRASVAETPNYVAINATAKFAIWDDPANTFLDYVDIEVSLKAGTSPSSLANFPVKVTLAENAPVGFSYSRAGMVDGDSLSFTTADGTPVPYEVARWDSSGESVLYVRVPLISTTPQKLRLYWKVADGANVPDHYPDEVWTDWEGPDSAKYKPYADKTSGKFGFVQTDGKTANYWTEYPEMSKTQWRVDEEPGTLVKEGKLAYPGTTIVKKIIDSITGDVLEEMPTTQSGVYRLSFVQDDPEERFSLPEFHIDFRITTRLPQDDLTGDATNVTAVGRILLANDDWATGHEITDQGYAQPHLAVTRKRSGMKWITVTNRYDIFWSHEGTHSANKANYPNIQPGSVHRLCFAPEKDGREVTNLVWRLQDVLIGNTSPANNNIVANKCALPWSATGGAFDSFTNSAAATRGLQKNAAHLMLRNQENAAIYSPCYTNGIGTVYFDAVNSWRDNLFWTSKGNYNDDGNGTPSYSLVLEMATNTVDNLEPTDANADGEDIDRNWRELGRIFEDTAEEKGQWHPVPMLPLVRDNKTTGFVASNVTDKLVLAINKGGSADNFCRICARINYRGPIRFRIRRIDTDIGRDADGNAFILVDNVIVSYPEMTAEMDSLGFYDGTRTGKQVVGQANAMMTPYPSIADKELLVRGRPTCYVSGLTNADPQTFIQLARLHYRWRYLSQVVPEEWKSIDMNERAEGLFRAETSVDFPRREGDLEYWYETFAQLPFYSYYDYSGKNLLLKGNDGAELYTEERATFTNRLALVSGQNLPSGGRDWFLRLRRGASEYEGIRIFVKDADGTVRPPVEAELIGAHCWRGVFPASEKAEDGLQVRFEAYNRQTPGTHEHATNVEKYKLHRPIAETPKTETLDPDGEETWTPVVCDGLTGHLVFQIDDQTRSVTLAHADYQNFNRWDDANKLEGEKRVYVGTSTDTNSVKMSGSSSKKQEFADGLGWWHLSQEANPAWWSEAFTNVTAETYVPFTSARSPNGFTVGPGMWVCGNCRDSQTGIALQMEGKGKGYIQFVNKDESPRGLKSVKFRARLGQSIEFDDFSYFIGGDITELKSYTFLTRAAYDTANRTLFSGNASVSVVGFLIPGVGCYEFRVEQENATLSGGKWVAGNTQRLSLYRWNYDPESGEIQPTLLGVRSVANDAALKTNGEHGNMSELFISVHDTGSQTVICAGLQRSPAAISTETGSTSYSWVAFTDTSADRHTCGSYGVLSANCPGRFVHELFNTSAQTVIPSDVKSTIAAYPGFKYNDNRSYTMPSGSTQCRDAMVGGKWAVMPRRMVLLEPKDLTYYGLTAVAPKQELKVYTAPAGKDSWEYLTNVTVSAFGDTATATEVMLRTVEDCSVRLATGGTDKSARNDVVIDDIEFFQWRGESYDDREGLLYFPEPFDGSPSNIVFTQAWIQRDAADRTNCLLSAKRSKADVATSVRSPLMDGNTSAGRGLGLGMFRFTYANAQTNVNLLLQVATNGVGTSNLEDWSKRLDDARWTTVTNFSFAGLPATNLVSGSRSYYFGLRGVKGVMRLVMDPKVVESVAAATNPDDFGEIEITGVVCRDEPGLDDFAWWGWNLRTTDEEELRSLGDQAAELKSCGMSLGLNNAVDRDIRDEDAALYPEHLPFVQTPTFAADVVGEVSFLARKQYASDPAARVTLFGARYGTTDDKDWTRLAAWDVTNETFTAYAYKTTPGNRFNAFRFAVTGVGGVKEPTMPDPYKPKQPLRVLVDDVLVMETVFAKVGFRNVAAFRSGLEEKAPTPGVTDRREQPLVGESWGVQAELYKAQLPDEVDLTGAKVRLWWFEGTSPWGFEKWRDNPKAKKAWLLPCEGEGATNVFKSCYFGASGAVIPASEQATTFQYMLEVQYASNQGVATNWLEQGDWEQPGWYHPLDYNAELGRGEGFSAYTILDTVSPGWAWINEVNLFGTLDWSWNNSDKPLQFLEIAAPSEADLTGWEIRFLDPVINGNMIITNTVARFGEGTLTGLKKDLKGMDTHSKCVFHVIGSPYAKGVLDADDGRLDGTWTIYDKRTTAVDARGEVSTSYPLSIQLVRPSGVVEHEITALGTNDWAYVSSYNPTNHVDFLNAHERGGRFFYVGMDTEGIPAGNAWSRSLGVWHGNGGTEKTLAESETNYWRSTELMTPGRLNGGQTISPDWPKPHGNAVMIYAMIEGGHLRQTFAEATETNELVTLVYRKDADEGTNITYRTDAWYGLGDVTVNGTAATAAPAGVRTWRLEVGRHASNDITVVARAAVDAELQRKYGLGPDNRYSQAVVDWLSGGRTLRGAFNDPDFTEPGLGDFYGVAGNFVTNLTLTEMYWLDMDPSYPDGVMSLRGGLCGSPLFEEKVVKVADDYYLTNVLVRAMLAVTNTATGAAWAPYVLRSDRYEVTSQDYAKPSSQMRWTNETFKVTGLLLNGGGFGSQAGKGIALRWFVFDEGSFEPADSPDRFTSRIEIVDPFSTESPGYSAGWYEWARKHGKTTIGWSTGIDDRLQPVAVEVLKPDSTYPDP